VFLLLSTFVRQNVWHGRMSVVVNVRLAIGVVVHIRLSVCQDVPWRGYMSVCLYDRLTIAVAVCLFVYVRLYVLLSVCQAVHWS
jgi:hypothetical protein